MNQEESVYELNRIQRYIMQMRPLLKKNALFSDGTADYRQPVEPDAGDEVTVRFRTARDNVDIVWLCTGDKKYKMKKTETGGAFDYYEVKFTLGEEPFYYYFKVASGLLNHGIFLEVDVLPFPRMCIHKLEVIFLLLEL